MNNRNDSVLSLWMPEDLDSGNPEQTGKLLADELFRVYLSQVLLDGTYHADPHPGNVLLTSDDRICLLDLGMVGNVPSPSRASKNDDRTTRSSQQATGAIAKASDEGGGDAGDGDASRVVIPRARAADGPKAREGRARARRRRRGA